MLIEDPKSGNVATVTQEGLLQVLGIAKPWETHVSDVHTEVYAVGNLNVTMAGSEKTILHVENLDSEKLLYITALMTGVLDTSGAKVTVYKGSSYTSGGTAAEPNNLNLTSRHVANVTAYYGNDITVSGGNPICGCISAANGMTIMPMGGVLILGYKDTLHITMNGTNTATGLLGLRFLLSSHE